MEELDYSIVVASTDVNKDLWAFLFETIKDNWVENVPEIMLITQKEEFCYPGLQIRRPRKQFNNEAWSERLIEGLKEIDTPYIILICDDYFLTDKVNEKELEKCITWMKKNPQIATIYFSSEFETEGIKSTIYEGYEERPKNSPYRLNCQAAVWNKEKLLLNLRGYETAWEMEICGSKRISNSNDLFLNVMDGNIVAIKRARTGVLIEGKWVLSEINPLIEKYSWSIDLSKRGIHYSLSNLPPHGKIPFIVRYYLKVVKAKYNYHKIMKKSKAEGELL